MMSLDVAVVREFRLPNARLQLRRARLLRRDRGGRPDDATTRPYATAAAVGCSRLSGRAARYSIQAANSASAASSERLRAAARTLEGTQSGKGTSLVT